MMPTTVSFVGTAFHLLRRTLGFPAASAAAPAQPDIILGVPDGVGSGDYA